MTADAREDNEPNEANEAEAGSEAGSFAETGSFAIDGELLSYLSKPSPSLWGFVGQSTPLILDDIQRAAERIKNATGMNAHTMVMSPRVYAAFNAQLIYMQTRRYRFKQWLRTKKARARNRFWKRWCRHPWKYVEVDYEMDVYCRRCHTDLPRDVGEDF